MSPLYQQPSVTSISFRLGPLSLGHYDPGRTVSLVTQTSKSPRLPIDYENSECPSAMSIQNTGY